MVRNKKTTKEDNLEAFINYYMEGNMRRFLRKHKKQYFYQLTYSRILPRIKKKDKKGYKKIMKEGLPPQTLRHIINIFKTLDKHFDIGFTIKGFRHMLVVQDELLDIIHDYMIALNSKRYQIKSPLFKKSWLTQKQAFKEQKARGFIHINNFQEFDPKASHIISNVNTDYYYPVNIYRLFNDKHKSTTNIICPYIFANLYAVEGHTRVSVSLCNNKGTFNVS